MTQEIARSWRTRGRDVATSLKIVDKQVLNELKKQLQLNKGVIRSSME